ncbi:uncharacterized protein HKW66_Vig0204480 [Vigna angularis]|uniref:Uncharacterized protein n=1 Tax=Phaseolus angularis TaxID=3914 RepID=A0A8T0JS57_PHAAN|nr:uncharacterized protein HKW66_Vig0204480 [Vigna angularis]
MTRVKLVVGLEASLVWISGGLMHSLHLLILQFSVVPLLGELIHCTPNWVLEVDVHGLKRLSNGLRQLNEEDLALALLSSIALEARSVMSENDFWRCFFTN